VIAGQTVSGGNFGDTFGPGPFPNSISGNKFQDTNGNGIKDTGEPFMTGVTIFLDANNNGVLDTGERTTTTGVGGTFTFTNVAPGTFRVLEVAPTNFVQTTNNPAAIIVTSSTNVTGILFGNIPLANLITAGKLLLTGHNLTNLMNGTLGGEANFVANLYQTLLGHAPDLNGLEYYLRLLMSGYTQAQVTAMFKADHKI
jgi:hypothetical protein